MAGDPDSVKIIQNSSNSYSVQDDVDILQKEPWAIYLLMDKFLFFCLSVFHAKKVVILTKSLWTCWGGGGE